jgi:hypothetical protein
MRYFTWKFDWSSGKGTDPTFTLNNDEVRIEPAFSTGDVQDPATLTYCYLLKGSINLAELTNWSVTETTIEDMLASALGLNPDATLVDGVIKFPEPTRA